MKSKRKSLFVGGAVIAIVVALALGAPVNTLLLLGPALLCPVMMFFCMRGMGNHRGDKDANNNEV